MSSLTDIDKRYLEKILGMESGYVLDFNDDRFGVFFAQHEVDIHSNRYQTHGSSKAKKLRSFWEQEADSKVAAVLQELLNLYQVCCELNDQNADNRLLEKCRSIVMRLSGDEVMDATETEDAFLDKEFAIPHLNQLPIESSVAMIIEARLEEARRAMQAQAYLSVIFLCGSVLEGVLLGTAQSKPEQFRDAEAHTGNDSGKVSPFPKWSLAKLIDVACNAGLLKPDVQKFGHGLRDFRNYIHPHQQMTSGFAPDQHTAKVCFQVLKAALADLAGKR